jgi:nucleotide-binding universal stress UspA family protein
MNADLFPLDGSMFSEQALPHASALAELFEAELVLLSVLEPPSEPPEIWRPAVRQAESMAKAATTSFLEGLATRLRERGIAVQVAMVEGRPHAAITQYAETEAVDLIVISSRGQSGLSRWLMGSVADRVTRGANVPVLLVRTRKT